MTEMVTHIYDVNMSYMIATILLTIQSESTIHPMKRGAWIPTHITSHAMMHVTTRSPASTYHASTFL
jgi:hypothetical protein